MISLDPKNFQVIVHGRIGAIDLTRREWDIINYLYENSDRICSKQEIIEHVWQGKEPPKDNNVEVYMNYLRNKLGKHIILTRRGFGYKLNTGE